MAGKKVKDGVQISTTLGELVADLYEGLDEGESAVMDVIITGFIGREIFGGKPATLDQIAKVTGMSTSGAKAVEVKALKRLKTACEKKHIGADGADITTKK